jgi:hypothetical protein
LEEQACEQLWDIPMDAEQRIRCRAAIETPILFSDALLVDPVIYSPSFYNAIVGKEAPLATAMGRIADFSSRFVKTSS